MNFNAHSHFIYNVCILFSDMAQLMNVRLSRVDAQPWGLRLQGGKDFGTPLVVQKVCVLNDILT